MKILLIKTFGLAWHLLMLVTAILGIYNLAPRYLICMALGALTYTSF